jgi:hypothetical protein
MTPTERLSACKAAEIGNPTIEDQKEGDIQQLRIVVDELKARHSEPKVKALEWEDYGICSISKKNAFGTYRVWSADTQWGWASRDEEPQFVTSHKEAQAACQADFERRVRECLEP